MISMVEIKNKFDNYEIEPKTLSKEQIIVLCDMYERQIQEIEDYIKDIDFRIDSKKNQIRRKLDEIKKMNSN